MTDVFTVSMYYSSYPEALSYDLLTMQKAVDKANGNDVLLKNWATILRHWQACFWKPFTKKTNVL
jgi:hypothetical protein